VAESALAVETRTMGAADGGCFALTTVQAQIHEPRAPVILLHGMFTDRRFWLSDKGVGLAAYLAARGHPVFIVQRRGLGDSPATEQRCGLDEQLHHDLPAVQAIVANHVAEPAFWLGHSFGGVTAARAVAQTLDASQVAGLVLIASQFKVGKRALDWPGNMLTRALVRVCGHLPARAVGLGPVNEPAAAAQDACRWVSEGRRQPEIRKSLQKITVPTLAISGVADRVDPTVGCERFVSHFSSADVRFVRAGIEQGFARDYDHAGVVISKPAQAEIWPLIGDWLTG